MAPEVDEVDIANWQMVGTNGEDISVMLPRQVMTKDQALVHAAWLVGLADPLGERFAAIRARVEAT